MMRKIKVDIAYVYVGGRPPTPGAPVDIHFVPDSVPAPYTPSVGVVGPSFHHSCWLLLLVGLS